MDDFVRDSTVSVLVPSGSDQSLPEILQQDGLLEERGTLYFDEHLRIVVVLETAQFPEARLNAYLQNLELKVEAWAVSPDGENRKSGNVSPTRDLIATESITALDDPVTLLKQREDSNETTLVLHWELLVTLSKPRIRLIDPSIIFVPVATIVPPDTQDADNDYVEAFSVREPNLLQPLVNGRDLADAPYLPVSRVERVLPSRSKEIPRVRLRHVASSGIRAYPAVMARLKYTRSNTYSPLPSTIASLDIEIIPFIDIQGSIEDVTVVMSNGSVTCLMDGFLPMTCSSKDCITILYALKTSQQPAVQHPSTALTSPTTNANIETLSISLRIELSVSTSCTAKIVMDWSTNVDFSQALNPSFGAPSQPMQRTNRPAGLNFGTTHTHAPKSASASSVIDASLQPLSHPTRPNELVTISFLAPSEPAIVGKPFVWKVLVMNRSPNVAKLAIVPLPRIQRTTTVQQHYAKKHAPKASSISVAPGALNKRLSLTNSKDYAITKPNSTERDNIMAAKAIVDENILYALHHSPGAVPPETDIISLTAELRLGPLGPGQCHESEIKFVAFKAGVFTVDAIRVVDLVREAEFGVNAPWVVKDLREVPDIVVVEASK